MKTIPKTKKKLYKIKTKRVKERFYLSICIKVHVIIIITICFVNDEDDHTFYYLSTVSWNVLFYFCVSSSSFFFLRAY